MNINVPVDLHNSFKATAAARGRSITDVLRVLIEDYVKNPPSAKKPKGRRQ